MMYVGMVVKYSMTSIENVYSNLARLFVAEDLMKEGDTSQGRETIYLATNRLSAHSPCSIVLRTCLWKLHEAWRRWRGGARDMESL